MKKKGKNSAGAARGKRKREENSGKEGKVLSFYREGYLPSSDPQRPELVYFRWKGKTEKIVVEYPERRLRPARSMKENEKGRVIDMRMTGELLKKRLWMAGLAVRDVQAATGLECPQSIYRWFNGQALPTVDNLYVLHRLLGCSMEYLLVTEDRSQLLRCAAYLTAI